MGPYNHHKLSCTFSYFIDQIGHLLVCLFFIDQIGHLLVFLYFIDQIGHLLVCLFFIDQIGHLLVCLYFIDQIGHLLVCLFLSHNTKYSHLNLLKLECVGIINLVLLVA